MELTRWAMFRILWRMLRGARVIFVNKNNRKLSLTRISRPPFLPKDDNYIIIEINE